jgi:thiamine transport system substrate-binding protein
MRRGIVAVLAIAVLAIAVLAGCGSSSKSSEPSSEEKKIETVNLLTHSSFATSKGLLDEFTKQSGYKVKVVQPGDAGVMVNQAILRKDNPIGDLMYGIDNTFLSRAFDNGIFEPYTAKVPTPADLQPDDSHRVTPIDTAHVCVIYDKTYFDKDGHPPAPASFDDLTKPEYKNQLVVEDAATSSPGLAFLLSTIDEKGEDGWQDYWKALRSNGVRVVDDWTAAYQTDFTAGGGSGDRPIVVSYSTDPAADIVFSEPKRDTPNVGVIESTCFRQTEFAGVLKNAKNTAGAQALLEFLLSKQFQEDIPAQMFVYPVVEGAKLPADFEKWAVVPGNPHTMTAEQIGENRDAWIKEWTDIAVR